jgi:hypothetical protein
MNTTGGFSNSGSASRIPAASHQLCIPAELPAEWRKVRMRGDAPEEKARGGAATRQGRPPGAHIASDTLLTKFAIQGIASSVPRPLF